MTSFERRLAYKTSMSLFRGLRSRGILTDDDYVKIDTKLAAKYGISPTSILH